MRGDTTDIDTMDPGHTWETVDPDNLLLTNERFRAALNALSVISGPSHSPDAFFRTCVAEISKAYDTRFAFIGMVTDQTKRDEIGTIASYGDGKVISNLRYPLKGSPCQEVLKCDRLFVPKGLARQYPEDDLLIDMGLDSYYGSVLKDSSGNKVGIVVVCDTRPMDLDPWIHPLLDLFASRISQEIERSKHLSELQLTSSVYENSNDAVLIVGPEFHILKANKSFENMTGYAESEVIGEFSSILRSGQEDADVYERLGDELQRTGFWSGDLWLRRKNGNLFPSANTMQAVRDPITGDISHFVMILSDQSQRKYAEERIHRLAYYDAATDLRNRTSFQRELKKALVRQRRTGEEFAVILIDLDFFKDVNDRLGHFAGDELLRQVAYRLRELDNERFLVARIGGDEFAALHFSNASDGLKEAVLIAAEEIQTVLKKPYRLEGETVTISTSLGVALCPYHGDDAKVLLRNADLATYHAKDHGRDRIEIYHDALCEIAENRALLAARLRDTETMSQFFLAYQPKYSIADRKPVGAEALLRWRLTDGTMVSPANFIPIAEETGLICDIGQWVMREAFCQSVAWGQSPAAFDRISINLSGRQMLANDFLERVTALIAETGVDTRKIELEITETWLMEDPGRSKELLQALKDLGFTLSIDDFGVAYSSMNYLRHFPVDIIKIDRSFIRHMEQEESSMAIISAIAAMGHSLGLEVLAEGVETDAQFDLLKSIGCDLCQGFLFAKPMTADELVDAEA